MSILKGIDETIDSCVEQWSETDEGRVAGIRNGLEQDLKRLIGTMYSPTTIRNELMCVVDKWVGYCKVIRWESHYEIHDNGVVMYLRPERSIKYYKVDVRINN